MTDKIKQARREAFEEWDTKTFGSADADHSINDDDGRYSDGIVDQCWRAFNAALDCVVIELPGERQKRQNFRYETLEDSAHNNCRDLCIDAIESTNLGIKVK